MPNAVRRPSLELKPQYRQEQFLSTPADIAIFGGAAGGGKTWGLLVEALRHKLVRKFNAVLFRRTFPRIVQAGGMWDEATDLYSSLATSNKTDYTWTFPSGARVKFAHLQHAETRFEYNGGQIPYIGYDQLEEFLEIQFWYLVSRNRSTCGVRPYMRATCNPVPEDDETGGWLHRLIQWWIDPESGIAIPKRSGKLRWFVRVEDDIVWGKPEKLERKYPGLMPQSVTFIPATLADNAILEQKDPQYRGRLLSLPRVERERLLGGNWNIRPTAGTVFDRSWFHIVQAAPSEGRVIRYWDKAATKLKPGQQPTTKTARSSGVKMRMTSGKWFIEDMVQGHWSAGQREGIIRQVAEADGPDVDVWVEQEPGSGGKESAENTIINLAGFKVHADKVTGSKVDRAGPLSAQAEAGNVFLVRAPWNEDLLAQYHRFEEGARQIDGADASVGAFNKLTLVKKRKVRVWYPGMDDEDDEVQDERSTETAEAAASSTSYEPAGRAINRIARYL